MKSLNRLLLALLFWVGTVASIEGDGINLDTFLTDEAEVLTPMQQKEISALLLAHSNKGPGRIYVFIAKRLPPETTIEKLAQDKINEPPLAAGDKNDRVLIAIALQDRQMRIETSRDVRVALPDSFCKEVITGKMTPLFKEQKYFAGIQSGISALITKLTPDRAPGNALLKDV